MSYKKVVEIAMQNHWINGNAAIMDGDPFSAIENPLTENSFSTLDHIDDLRETFIHGNWAIRSAFIHKNLAFINQVDGGDEWLIIKEFEDGEAKAFESVSFDRMIQEERFDAYIERLLKATKDQYGNVTY